MNSQPWVMLALALALGIGGWAAAGMAQGTTAPAFIDAGRYNTRDSASCGIQEAIDALPPEGGTVLIPPGAHILHRPIVLKPHSKLVGAGRSTVLKKDAAFVMKITADVPKGQNYLEVEDASKLKIGACLAAGDRAFHPTINETLIITNISGNKVFFYVLYATAKAGTYRTFFWKDLAVARGACVLNLFVLVVPARDTVVTDLELDGNAAEQRVDFLKTTDIFTSYGSLWSGIFPAQGKVERCWIHDCGIGLLANGLTGVEIRNCEVFRNTADGIHVGSGPHSMIVNNRIYENGAAGISFCYGNRKLIITGNEIMRNIAGIYCLGNGEAARDTTADRYTVVSQNIIYENRGAGLASGQGNIGPQDFVFTDNIIQNNQQNHYRRAAPAGIMFENPKRCVIANNRCFDDREAFPGYLLAKAVPAGASNISLVLAEGRANIFSELSILANDWLRIGAGSTAGVYAVVSVSNQAIQLSQPVFTNLAADTPVVRIAAQKWGIAILGEEAEGNVIAGNVCVGQGSGGILIRGASNNVVANNAGTTVPYDPAKSPVENFFPAIGVVSIPNGDFEADAVSWALTKDAFCYDATPGVAHSGKRSLKRLLRGKEDQGSAPVTQSGIAVAPNTRYRLKAWVRSDAKTANGATALPYLAAFSNGKQLGLYGSNPVGFMQDQGFVGRADWPTQTWIQTGYEFMTGPNDTQLMLKCLFPGTGEGWVDDISLEIIDSPAAPAGNLKAAKIMTAPLVEATQSRDGALNNVFWKKAAASAGGINFGRRHARQT